MTQNRITVKNMAWTLGLVAASLLFGRYLSVPAHIAPLTNVLNETKTGVERLAAAATAGAAAITLLPGDVATPVAQKLTNLSGCFLWILLAVYVEKLLLVVSGFLVFQVIIPVGLLLQELGGCISSGLKRFGWRLVALGLVMGFLVPVSIRTSSMVRNQYEAELNAAAEAAEQGVETVRSAGAHVEDEDEGLWSRFVNKIKGGTEAVLGRLETMVNGFVDAIVIYMVTTCVIPAATFIFGLWAAKTILGIPQKRLEIPGLPEKQAVDRGSTNNS